MLDVTPYARSRFQSVCSSSDACDGLVASDEKVSSAMASEQAHKKRTRRMNLTRYSRKFAINSEYLFV